MTRNPGCQFVGLPNPTLLKTRLLTILHHCIHSLKLVANPCYARNVSGPRINRGDHLFTAKVKGDCWSSPHRSLICPQDQQCWLPQCWLSIASTLSINCLYVDHWSAPQDQQCWSPPCWSSIASTLTVDWPPPTDYDFLIFNIRITQAGKGLSKCAHFHTCIFTRKQGKCN